jgi:hypothetical protein
MLLMNHSLKDYYVRPEDRELWDVGEYWKELANVEEYDWN